MPAGFMRQKFFTPTEVGFNATSIDSAADGLWLPCDGYNRMGILCFHDYAAATGVELYLDLKDSDGNVYQMTVDTDDGSGVYTASRWKRQFTTGADARWEFYVERLNAKFVRLSDVLGQGSPSGDIFTARVWLAYAGD